MAVKMTPQNMLNLVGGDMAGLAALRPDLQRNFWNDYFSEIGYAPSAAAAAPAYKAPSVSPGLAAAARPGANNPSIAAARALIGGGASGGGAASTGGGSALANRLRAAAGRGRANGGRVLPDLVQQMIPSKSRLSLDDEEAEKKDKEDGSGFFDVLSSLASVLPAIMGVASGNPLAAFGAFARGGAVAPQPPPPATPGLLAAATPGRSDVLARTVPSGSYVIPADVVSALGDGNTLAGARVLDALTGTAAATRAKGGRLGSGPSGVLGMGVPVKAAAGEYIVPPPRVAALGQGDIKRGHAVLDNFVTTARKNAIKRLKSLPGPRK